MSSLPEQSNSGPQKFYSCKYCKKQIHPLLAFCVVCKKRIPLEIRLSREEFYKLHFAQGLTCKKIAAKYNISSIYVLRLKKKYKIPTNRIRPNRMPRLLKSVSHKRPILKEEIEKLYVGEKKTLIQIAEILGTTRQTLAKYMTIFGIDRKNRSNYAGYHVKKDFFSTWSEEMARVLGLILTDGCVSRGAASLHLSFASTDEDLVNQVRASLGSNHPIRVIRPYRYSKKTQYHLTISNQEVVKDLLAHGITERKSATVKMPVVPPEYLRHFVRGVFEGDGSLHVNGGTEEKPIYRMTFVSGSAELIKGLACAIEENWGIKGHLYKDREREFYQLIFNSTADIYELGRLMYIDVPNEQILRRKREIFTRFEETQYRRHRLKVADVRPS